MTVKGIIDNAKYLLEFQKASLLSDLEDEGLDNELDKSLSLRTLLNEFFRRVLGVDDPEGILNTNEYAELNRLIEELTK